MLLKLFALTSLLVVSPPDGGYIDGGVADAGKTLELDDKRQELLIRIEVLADSIKKSYSNKKMTVSVKEILFATVKTENSDAAEVIFDVGGQSQGVFFFYGDGKWQIFPSDFTVIGK